MTPRDQRQLWQSGLSGLLIPIGAMALASGYRALGIAACGAAIALTIADPGRRAVRALRRGSLDINALMVIAVTGAVVLGDFVEAATVIWLFGIAEWL